MKGKPVLSIVIPFYNEEQSIRELHASIVSAADALGRSYEMIFVDDGSQDRTLEVSTAVAYEDPRVTVVSFRRNAGQTAAMVAGIRQAQGEIIVTMDGDLENDPRDIEQLLAKIHEGCDIAVGWRQQREDGLLLRRVPSLAANRLIGWITGVRVHDNGCSLKAFRASLIKALPLYVEMHRFIPAIASIAGSRIAEVKVRHRTRPFGRSKYGLSRVYKVLLDVIIVKMLTSFTSRPLLWFSLMAAPLALVGLLMLADSLRRWAGPPGDLPMPVAGSGLVFLMAGTIFFLGGVLGEFIFHYGDFRERRFSRLTARVWTERDHDPAAREATHA